MGLILAGDLALGVTSGVETLTQMRSVATGAVALAEGLREQVFMNLEQAIVQVLTAQEAVETPPAPANDDQEISTDTNMSVA